MFKGSYWIILFFTVFFAFHVVFEYEVSTTTKMQQESLRLEEFGISAAQSALMEAELTEEEIFGDKDTRDLVVNTFYTSYARCANYSEKQINDVKYLVPCLILVDWDGYYINYTQWYKTTGETLYTNLTTEKNYWMKQYGDYIVQYTLTDNICLSDKTGQKEARYEGNYEEIYQILCAEEEKEELKHLSSKETFEEEKNSVVITEIENVAEYYVNTHNEIHNKLYANYDIMLPVSDTDPLAACLHTPSIIAFIQGSQTQGKQEDVNIYTYVGVDLEPEHYFYIRKESDGTNLYHTSDCILSTESIGSGTMLECAKMGSNPAGCIYGQECKEKRE